jgi:hypothetical protein
MRTRRYRKRGGNGENTTATQPPAAPGILSSVTDAFTGFVDQVKTKAGEFQENVSSLGNKTPKDMVNNLTEGVEKGLKQAQVSADGFFEEEKKENVGGRRRKSKRKRTKRR